VVSEEHKPVPGVLYDEEGPEGQEGAAVAVGDDTALLAWADDRANPWGSSGFDILLARYALDGSLRDPQGIRVAETHDDECLPSVAYAQGTFLVVWWAITQSPNGSGGDGRVRCARVAPDGTVLDPHGIELASNAGPPVVTAVQDRFVVAFEPNAGGPLRVAVVSTAGVVLGPAIEMGHAGYNPSLAASSSQVLLGYESETQDLDRLYHLALLGVDGTFQSDVSFASWGTALAGSPSSFLVMSRVVGNIRRMAPTGGWLDPAALQFGSSHALPGLVSAAHDGDGYLVASTPGDLSVRRLDDDATELGPAVMSPTETTHPYGPRIAAGDAMRVVAWSDRGRRDIRLVRLDASGAPLDTPPKRAPHGSTSQIEPALGRVDQAPLLAFCESSKQRHTVRYALLDEDGEQPASAIADIPDACNPAIAAGDHGTLLAWERDDGPIGTALVSSDGSLGPETTIASASDQAQCLRAAATPTGFVITYQYLDEDPLSPLLRAVTLDTGGAITGEVDLGQGWAAIPFRVGQETLVAKFSGSFSPSDVTVRPLSSESETTLGRIAPGEAPAAATDGSRGFVVWTDHVSRRVVGSVVDPSGAPVGSPVGISPPGQDAIGATVGFAGSDYVVIWRNLAAPQADLHGARVTTDGVLQDPEGFVVTAEPGNELRPVLTPWASSAVVAYGRFDPVHDAVRVMTRTLELVAEAQ
jgi:hypothetical protein